jgi:hypothetical protein
MDMTHIHTATTRLLRPSRAQLADLALATLRTLVSEVDGLIQAGHAVVGWDYSAGLLTIQLAASPRLAAMADEQRGAYFMRGTDAHGEHYRRGQLLDSARGVRVIWIERGH